MEKDPDVREKVNLEPHDALGQQFCGVFVFLAGLRFRIGIASTQIRIHHFTKMRIRVSVSDFSH
jgi:hypothetical protein